MRTTRHILVQPGLITCILLLFYAGPAWGNIDDNRKFQLDSITTNIDKTIRKDLPKAHAYLHAQGKNDEERVWLFYGFIATHFKYDDDRKNQKDRPEYSAGYTMKKLSGVCEDFAILFRELCDMSDIPCLVVGGKAKKPVLEEMLQATQNFLKREGNRVDHAWNVVKIDTAWKLMDPTWSHVLRTEKRRIYDPVQKRNVQVSIRIVDREYYAKEPELMKEDHKPLHPAFFLTADVPTFKTGLRKEKRRKNYRTNYAYAATLDSIFSEAYPLFSKIYHDEVTRYTSMHILMHQFKRELVLPVQKTATPVTIEEYETNLQEVNRLGSYIQQHFNCSVAAELQKYEAEVNKKIVKLKRIRAQQQPKRKAVAQQKKIGS